MKLTNRQKKVIESLCKGLNQKDACFYCCMSLSSYEKELRVIKDMYLTDSNTELIYKVFNCDINNLYK